MVSRKTFRSVSIPDMFFANQQRLRMKLLKQEAFEAGLFVFIIPLISKKHENEPFAALLRIKTYGSVSQNSRDHSKTGVFNLFPRNFRVFVFPPKMLVVETHYCS